MAAVTRFKDLLAWQRCMELSDVIFQITETGPAAGNFRFRDQIRDAAQSSATLIAEGFVRFLPREFVRYLRMARAEIAEVQSDLEEAKTRNYFSEEQLTRATIVARRAMSLTTRLLQSKLAQLDQPSDARTARTKGAAPSRKRR